MAHILAPQPPLARRQRSAGLRKLERTDDPATVVRVDECSGLRIAVRQRLVRGLGAELVGRTLPAFPFPGRRRGRQPELDKRRPEVEAGPADDDRRPALLEGAVDRRMRQLRVLPTDASWSRSQTPTSSVGKSD